jgi:hypothetical protein
MASTWSVKDLEEAYKQGWGPFHHDDGGYLILKLDDPENACWERDLGEFKGTVFPSDEAAEAFVRQRAAEGDDLCKRALQFVADNRSRVYDDDYDPSAKPTVEEVPGQWRIGPYKVKGTSKLASVSKGETLVMQFSGDDDPDVKSAFDRAVIWTRDVAGKEHRGES